MGMWRRPSLPWRRRRCPRSCPRKDPEWIPFLRHSTRVVAELRRLYRTHPFPLRMSRIPTSRRRHPLWGVTRRSTQVTAMTSTTIRTNPWTCTSSTFPRRIPRRGGGEVAAAAIAEAATAMKAGAEDRRAANMASLAPRAENLESLAARDPRGPMEWEAGVAVRARPIRAGTLRAGTSKAVGAAAEAAVEAASQEKAPGAGTLGTGAAEAATVAAAGTLQVGTAVAESLKRAPGAGAVRAGTLRAGAAVAAEAGTPRPTAAGAAVGGIAPEAEEVVGEAGAEAAALAAMSGASPKSLAAVGAREERGEDIFSNEFPSPAFLPSMRRSRMLKMIDHLLAARRWKERKGREPWRLRHKRRNMHYERSFAAFVLRIEKKRKGDDVCAIRYFW
mmetsp:Transcript_23886/g.57598  ORF Transcript_23886/g.57598 Transcript_23886/m.57598 type:complete len:389 (+) Transcript_23886:670-1836(+)